MTISTVLDLGGDATGRRATTAAADRLAPGVVAVHVTGMARAAASCSCGWSGGRRFLRAAAEQDAWFHAMHDRCEVSCPLVTPW